MSPNPPFSHDELENGISGIFDDYSIDLPNNSNVVAIHEVMHGIYHGIQNRIISGTMRIVQPERDIGDIRFDDNGTSEYTEFGWVRHGVTVIDMSNEGLDQVHDVIDTDIGMAWTININNTDDAVKEKYHKCDRCYEFSLVFGGSKHISLDGETIMVDSEEKFEIVKGHFVEHWNKEHRDLINKRRDMPKLDREFKKAGETYWGQMGDSSPFIFGGTSIMSSRAVFGESMFYDMATPVEHNPNQQDQHVYEYQRRDTRLRNMDRGSRFRERMRNG